MKKIFALLIVFQIIFSKDFFAQHAGDLDSTFGVNGIVVTEFEGYDIRVEREKPDGIKAIFSLTDGKILCAGTADNGKHFISVRYNEDGSIDETYGIGGFVIVENLGFVSDAKMTENGNLIIAGYDSSNIVLLKLKFDGTIDSTFGEYGKVYYTFISSSSDTVIDVIVNCITIQSDNKILVGGSIKYNITELLLYSSNSLVVRFYDNGLVDTSFANNGVFIKPSSLFLSLEDIYDIYSFPDNSSLLIGHNQFSHTLIRLNGVGIIDSSFAVDGRLLIYYTISAPSDAYGTFYSGIKLNDGDLILIGNVYLPFPFYTPSYVALAKLNLSGHLDSTFAIEGKNSLTDFDSVHIDYFHLSIQQMDNSKLISSGYKDSFTKNFHIIRYNKIGFIDSTFGTNGIINTLIGNSCMALCSALQDDGKLLVAGVSDSGAFTIARYHAHSDTPTSILPLEKNHTLLLYPNPVSDILFIDKIQEPILQIDIRNILGREMHLPINNQSIDVSSLPSGLYFIKITTDKGESFGKFVKE